MATIKAIEGRSVHQIQSGQVIVDLCSVVKELVENSLDAGSTSIEIRFRNYGLESIEVQDNGAGIRVEDYNTIALKHYTSKLSTYDDLTSLRTFGFRGEALSSLCALSDFHVITATAEDAPKGTKLDFETSGALKKTSTVACQKGTTVSVQGIFQNLPVRRRELEKNIKREYGKVLTILNGYACISVAVKFFVSNQPTKGKRAVAFATKSNPTTRENIANVFGAKTLTALVPLNLSLELQPSNVPSQRWSKRTDTGTKEVKLVGHISRPLSGEGRQVPDRQMFFVNGRPCGLPQVSKAINEVYKSYNLNQSPFVFADLLMDTSDYDVNVSPDKRSILLHDQSALLEKLKEKLMAMFEGYDHSMPQSQLASRKMPSLKQLHIQHSPVVQVSLGTADHGQGSEGGTAPLAEELETNAGIIEHSEGDGAQSMSDSDSSQTAGEESSHHPVAGIDDSRHVSGEQETGAALIRDFNAAVARSDRTLADSASAEDIPFISSNPLHRDTGVVKIAFDRMRPKRVAPETATITIGSKTVISPIGTPVKRRKLDDSKTSIYHRSGNGSTSKQSRIKSFARGISAFRASGKPNNDEDAESVESESCASPGDLDSVDSSETDDADVGNSAQQPESEASPRKAVNDVSVPEIDSDGSVVDAVDMDGANESIEDDDDCDGDHAHNDDSAGDDDVSGSEDDEYIDDAEKKARDEAVVARLIQEAEEAAARPSGDNLMRATRLLKSNRGKRESTYQLLQTLPTSMEGIESQLRTLDSSVRHDRESTSSNQSASLKDPASATSTSTSTSTTASAAAAAAAATATSAEETLSLTVSKADFAHMRIVGQFNLGFILAARGPDLFIIDQHASDEKYNFERLQRITTLAPQPLVHPLQLTLTALDEELILNHAAVLEKNGFLARIDTSGAAAPGHRCSLLALPASAEVVFGLSDLEELLALLADSPSPSLSSIMSHVPRPGKVRRMFAMRACRSSIMVGRTLTRRQMAGVVSRMGEIEMPWNCPHGRPTMRHVVGLAEWRGWAEGDGVSLAGDSGEPSPQVDWAAYAGSGGAEKPQ
ncbi:MAG: hypothetical protein M1825_004470 [Sarcosagium campestre]|nr:MAG: hypothetical protein M1825_004470 [Sarcosagium campestre]